MKKIIMIALAALTISESNILASSLLTQTSTYYQDGSAMKDDGIIYTMPDGVTQYHVDRTGSCYKVDSSSTTAIAYTQGLSVASQNAQTFDDSLRPGTGNLDNDKQGFASAFIFTGAGYYLNNALYQKSNGTKVNNIKKLIATVTLANGNVSYDQWNPVYGNKISTTDFLAAMNTVGGEGCSVALNQYSKTTTTPANVVFNILMSTATNTVTNDNGSVTVNYWNDCSVSTSSSTTSTLLGYFNFSNKTYYVAGTITTAAKYNADNATTPSGQQLV